MRMLQLYYKMISVRYDCNLPGSPSPEVGRLAHQVALTVCLDVGLLGYSIPMRAGFPATEIAQVARVVAATCNERSVASTGRPSRYEGGRRSLPTSAQWASSSDAKTTLGERSTIAQQSYKKGWRERRPTAGISLLCHFSRL